MDDAGVDYTSLLDTEQRRARLTTVKKYLQCVTKIFAAVRFSEELLDKEVRESVALGKMYRELQRHVNCWDRTKVPTRPRTGKRKSSN